MLTKKFFKTKDTCQVTFQLPKEVEAKSVALVGEFNDWDTTAHPMKKVKGIWKTTLVLENGHEYQFVTSSTELSGSMTRRRTGTCLTTSTATIRWLSPKTMQRKTEFGVT